MSSARGLILIDHGSRLPEAHQHIESLARQLRTRYPGRTVAVAHLEIVSPTLRQAVRTLIDRGIIEIELLPMFLAPGNHLTRDIPTQVADAVRAHPEAKIRVLPAVGELPGLVDLIGKSLP